jgi:hypothetical protein
MLESDATQMDRANDIRGGKYDVRFVDLQSWHRIRARCTTCNHVGIIDPAVVKALRFAARKRR